MSIGVVDNMVKLVVFGCGGCCGLWCWPLVVSLYNLKSLFMLLRVLHGKYVQES